VSLRAFEADALELLWSRDRDEPADNLDFAKNVPPTIANGKVYLATFSDRLNVYGLHSPVAAMPKPPPNLSRNLAIAGTSREAAVTPAIKCLRDNEVSENVTGLNLAWSRAVDLSNGRAIFLVPRPAIHKLMS